MASCAHCQTELPPFSLHCVECGRPVVPATIREQNTVDRLRSMANARGATGQSATLMGSRDQPRASDETRTVPEGDLSFDALAGIIDGPLSDETLREPSPLRNEAPERTGSRSGPPSLVPLQGLSGDAPDRGEPARKRPEPTPAAAPAAPPPRTGLPSIGEVVDGYRIEAEIGRGGMGRVYRAVHEVTGQQVALKMLLPQLVSDQRLRARFINEAKVLARLEHRNLVPLLGFIEDGQRAFIVMPYVEGVTLERMLRRQGRLPFETALSLFRQICDGLQHVHDGGVMHRDLKPSNVIVRADGRACITDFGIARALGSEKLTMTGMVVGTAEYLSPEQASGAVRDDLRSDIYSLAVLLYEMVTGRVPFRHPSPAQVLLKHVQSPPPPPRTISPELPEAVEAALLKALEKEPEARFPSVLAFRDAVTAGFEAPSTAPPAAAAEPAPRPTPPATPAPALAVRPMPAPLAAPSRPAGRRLLGQVLLGVLLGGGLATAAWFFLARSG